MVEVAPVVAQVLVLLAAVGHVGMGIVAPSVVLVMLILE